MTQFVKTSLLALLALSLNPRYCASYTQLANQSFSIHSKEASIKFNGSEIKGPFSRPIRAAERLRANPLGSRVLRNQALEKENNLYDTAEDDYYYDDNSFTYGQIDLGNGNEDHHIQGSPFVTLPKLPFQPDNRLQSGYFDPHYHLPHETPSWQNFLRTVATCLPFGLVAAAIPLGFVNFETVTMTVTTTTTEEVEGGPVPFLPFRTLTTTRPEGEEVISVQPTDLLYQNQIPIGCSSTSGNCSRLHLSPSPVLVGNGSTSDLAFVKRHLANWTSVDPKSMNAIPSRLDDKVNLQREGKNVDVVMPLDDPPHEYSVQSGVNTDANIDKPSHRGVVEKKYL
ncbi:uncharacterized protein LOC131876854 isoform X2 [Tigriopus californicus]|uniref:uncharacterized protein LOC131876854 isoform X2 n=1 Tax=Tigriopus californicus TaxID=6832 RepID=UPI0027DA3C41|nr:uncharacterized protein LOC131876854 isoform X2 [Tigriopus californicus]